MKRDSPFKHIATAFAIALVLYIVAYGFIENRRTRKGSWQVAFTNNAAGSPVLLINQPFLAITNVQIAFPGAPLPKDYSPGSMTFDRPREVPYDLFFTKCIFMDTTFLPGTIVFDAFGHEIQLIPRVLTIDKTNERPWRSDEIISLPPSTNQPSPKN